MKNNSKLILTLALIVSISSTNQILAEEIKEEDNSIKNEVIQNGKNLKNKSFLTSKVFDGSMDIDINNDETTEEKPIIKDIKTTTEKIEEGTKITNTMTVESNVPIRYFNSSFKGPNRNIYGGGHGVRFDKVGENQWQYTWTNTVSKYAPSGKYRYEDISVENASFLKSEVYDKAIIIDINNDETTEEKPIIKDIKTTTEKIEEGTKITNIMTVESNVPIRYFNSSFKGPNRNIYGGGHGVRFDKVGENQWQYTWTDTVSRYAPSGKYRYEDISVENSSFLKSEVYDKNIIININNDETTEEKPIIKDISMDKIQCGEGIKLINTITVESKVPIRYFNSSFEGPNRNIYGGGHGVRFDKVGENQWQYTWTDTVSRYAPSGKYKYEDISVENASFLKSEVYDKELYYNYNQSIYDNFIPVTGINIENEEIKMYVGDEKPFKYFIEPIDATNKEVIINNRNSDIVEIKNGKIIAKKEGYSNINIRTIDGDYREYLWIHVRNKDDVYYPNEPEKPNYKPVNPDDKNENTNNKPGNTNNKTKESNTKKSNRKKSRNNLNISPYKDENVKELNKEKVELVLKIDDLFLIKDGEKVEMDVAPVIKDNRTLLPIRFIIESMNGNIFWNNAERKVIIVKDNTTIELWIDKKEMKVNGETKTIDVAPEIINDRTYLPIRFIMENIPGYTVEWNEITREVTIK